MTPSTKWVVGASIFYVLAIITSVLLFPGLLVLCELLMQLFNRFIDPIDASTLNLIFSIVYLVVFFALPILSLSASIRGMKHRKESRNPIHRTAMVLGVLTLNLPLLIAGYFCHKGRVRLEKVVAVVKGVK